MLRTIAIASVTMVNGLNLIPSYRERRTPEFHYPHDDQVVKDYVQGLANHHMSVEQWFNIMRDAI